MCLIKFSDKISINKIKFVKLIGHIFDDCILAVYHSIISSDVNYSMTPSDDLLQKYPISSAITYELCAGICDKSKPLVEIAQEEVLEECGYNVPVERIELVMTYRYELAMNENYASALDWDDCVTKWMKNSSVYFYFWLSRAGVGTEGSIQTLYYCEVTDEDKATSGGGVGDEIIDVVEFTLDECRKMIKQGAMNNAPPSCLLGISWFLTNKAQQWFSIRSCIPHHKWNK